MLDAFGGKKTDSVAVLEMEQNALKTLRGVLRNQLEWVKVHAAEYLLWTGNAEGVQEEYLLEEKLYGTKPPYRIGIWRVLAQAATTDAERKTWTDKIKSVFIDSVASDRTHAAETLAKLKISPLSDDRHLTEQTLNSPVRALALYTAWSVAFSAPDSLEKAPAKFLDMILKAGSDPSGKSTPAYALRQMKGVSDHEWDQLATLALSEPLDSPARIYLLSAAFTTSKGDRKPEILSRIHTELLKYKTAASKGDLSEMCAALAEKGAAEDLPMLDDLARNQRQQTSESDKADVAAAACYAILKISKRNK